MHATDTLSAIALLDLWERGRNASLLERALCLLEATAPAGDDRQPAELTIGERDAQLLSLRQGLFGDQVTAVADCPSCGERVEIEFTLSELGGTAEAAPTSSCSTLQLGGYEVVFRLPTSADLIAVLGHPTGATTDLLLARCLESVSYMSSPLDVPALPTELTETVCERMGTLDPRADIALVLSCSRCANEWSAPFDIASFLWDEIASWARRTLHEVNALAAAYGWTEEAILGLSAWRRRTYVEMEAER